MISVIIPTKNSAKTLPECLKSVFEQTLLPNEIIIVDNYSQDLTRQIAELAGCQVLRSQGTIASQRNRGVVGAKGKIIAFLDSDVIADKNWLKNSKRLLEKYDCVGAEPRCGEKSSWTAKTFEIHRTKSTSSYIPTHALCVKREVFEKVQFDENLETCEDCDFSYRLKENGFKIKREQKLAGVHLGEARSLGEFFTKEAWHAKGMTSLINKQYPLRYYKAILFSLAIPIVIATSMTGLYLESISLAITPVALFAVLLIVKSLSISRNIRKAIPLSCVYFIYSIARLFGMIKTLTKA